ncbi:hypothetical protein SAMN02745824_0286 [Parasphingorhabdus marina DSM 22363]|uniref:Uncharacterized protein n=1 Tax=Parasphingorhabdus marina DSM 22363 TaxID=1123272 RepID=A0A1N6CME5_9SPHN|nr:hypothetical protein SAMN02745824_0286 [Parasphingorhabdus marina DSM 22363]
MEREVQRPYLVLLRRRVPVSSMLRPGHLEGAGFPPSREYEVFEEERGFVPPRRRGSISRQLGVNSAASPYLSSFAQHRNLS